MINCHKSLNLKNIHVIVLWICQNSNFLPRKRFVMNLMKQTKLLNAQWIFCAQRSFLWRNFLIRKSGNLNSVPYVEKWNSLFKPFWCRNRRRWCLCSETGNRDLWPRRDATASSEAVTHDASDVAEAARKRHDRENRRKWIRQDPNWNCFNEKK